MIGEVVLRFKIKGHHQHTSEKTDILWWEEGIFAQLLQQAVIWVECKSAKMVNEINQLFAPQHS